MFISQSSGIFSLRILSLHLKIFRILSLNLTIQIFFLRILNLHLTILTFFQNSQFKSHISYCILRILSLRLTIMTFFQNSQFKSHNLFFPSNFEFTSRNSDFLQNSQFCKKKKVRISFIICNSNIKTQFWGQKSEFKFLSFNYLFYIFITLWKQTSTRKEFSINVAVFERIHLSYLFFFNWVGCF